MAIILNDNIKVNAGKPSEAKYLNPNTNAPYSGVTQVNTLIPISERHRGLTVLVNDKEYWYRDGVSNTDLILKTSTGTTTLASNGLTKLGNTIVLGGTLTGDTTIGGAGNSLYFGDFNVSEFNEFIVAVSGTSGLIGLYGKDDAIIEISTNHTTQNSIVISAGLSGDNSTINIDYQKLRLSSNDSVPSNVFIELSGASKIVIGENNFSDFAGIQYLTDYSANYTARSIPDVGFVTGYTSPQNIYNQKIIVSANTTLTNTNFVVFVDSSTSGLTITLPASPVDGQVYKIKDVGSANINNIIIDGNGNTIDGFPTAIINTQRGGIEIVYDQTIDEWALLNYIP